MTHNRTPVPAELVRRYKDPLPNARQERFCQLFVAAGPGASRMEAFRAAGYTGKREGQVFDLMRRVNVSARIAYLQERAAARAVVDGAAALRRSQARASVALTDYMEYDEHGVARFKPSAELTPDQRLGLRRFKGRKVTRHIRRGKPGELGEVVEVETTEEPMIELHDPQAPNHDILLATGQLAADGEPGREGVTVNVWGPPKRRK